MQAEWKFFATIAMRNIWAIDLHSTIIKQRKHENHDYQPRLHKTTA